MVRWLINGFTKITKKTRKTALFYNITGTEKVGGFYRTFHHTETKISHEKPPLPKSVFIEKSGISGFFCDLF
jgi:hypothetical protein